MLTNATTSMLPMLLLVFLEKSNGQFDVIQPNSKLLGPHS